jgi:tetratricopeptide (TPR) repeat protein
MEASMVGMVPLRSVPNFAAAICVLLAITIGPVAAKPPYQVPEGMSAAQYLDLGKEYKASGWTEQARDALNRSIKADPEGIGKKAETYLRAYLPRYPVPAVAVQKNIAGFNQLARGDQEGAIRTFQECILQFPDFEWPYGNLGSVYVQQGRTKEARDILEKALAINPSYVNGWLHLAEAKLKDGDLKGAHEAARMAQQADPDNLLAKLLPFLVGPRTLWAVTTVCSLLEMVGLPTVLRIC